MSTKKQQNQKGEEDSLDGALHVLLLDFVVPGGLRTAKEALISRVHVPGSPQGARFPKQFIKSITDWEGWLDFSRLSLLQ